MAGIKNWSTTAGDNDDADSDINWAENQAPSTVNDSARQMMAKIRSFYETTEWRDWGHTVTRTANTTFTIPTDVTAIYVVNRPIKCTDSSTLYGYVASSSYGAPNTTVTVTLDSGNLSASLTAVSLGADPSTKSIHATTVRGALQSSDANNFTADQTITSTDAGATVGPNLILDRNSASPADADVLGAVVYKGRDDGGGTDTYAQIQAEAVDTGAASEDGKIAIQTAVAGTLATRMSVAQGILVGSATGGDPGDGKVNATDYQKNGTSLPIVANSIVGVYKCGGTNVPQGTTRYLGVLGSAARSSENEATFYPAYTCTAYELRVHANAAVAVGQSFTFTLRKNGADTSCTATISAGQTDASDSVNTVNFDTSDYASIKVVASGGTGSTTDVTATLRAKHYRTSMDCGFGVMVNAFGTTPGASTYWPGEGPTSNGTEAEGQVPLRACVAKNLRSFSSLGTIQLNTAVSDNTQVRKNGVAKLVGSYSNDEVVFEDNDLFSVWYNNSDGTEIGASVGLYDPDNGGVYPGYYGPVIFHLKDQAQSTTRYAAGYGFQTLISTESEVQIPMPACTLTKLRAAAESAPAAGQTITYTVRKNGTDTALTCQVTSAGRTASDTSNTVAFAAGDLMSISSVTSATSGTRSSCISVEAVPT